MRIRGVVLVVPVAGLLTGCAMLGTMLTPVADPAPPAGWSLVPDAPDPASAKAPTRLPSRA